MADAPYLRHALGCCCNTYATAQRPQTIIRLETSPPALKSGSAARSIPNWHDPLAHVDQLLTSSDASRGRQAVDLLRLALSRALIELHGGQWGVEQRSGDEPALVVTLPLAHEMAESDSI